MARSTHTRQRSTKNGHIFEKTHSILYIIISYITVNERAQHQRKRTHEAPFNILSWQDINILYNRSRMIKRLLLSFLPLLALIILLTAHGSVAQIVIEVDDTSKVPVKDSIEVFKS